MKISHSTQRRTIILVVVVALFALFHLAQMSVQMFNMVNPLALANSNYTYIGEMDTQFNNFTKVSSPNDYSIVLERATDGSPMVEALPLSVVILSTHPDYTRPDHFGWAWNNAVTYIALALFVAIVIMVAWMLLGAIRGFKTGNIFKNIHSRMLRWIALLVFLYYFFNENREVFRELAVGELYGEAMPFDLYSALTISTECLIAPLLLLIFAELMAVAARINEEESMTI